MVRSELESTSNATFAEKARNTTRQKTGAMTTIPRRKQVFEDKKTESSKRFKRAGFMALCAGIRNLISLLPSVAWRDRNTGTTKLTSTSALSLLVPSTAATATTCVTCQIDGKQECDEDWSICYLDGEQFFTDDCIGEFSVIFTMAEEGGMRRGALRSDHQVPEYA
ncbi:MAG: hypothetical protein Q9193_003696 [Seirophora villosa]